MDHMTTRLFEYQHTILVCPCPDASVVIHNAQQIIVIDSLLLARILVGLIMTEQRLTPLEALPYECL